MFGLGPGELVTAVILLVIVAAVVGVVVRIGLLPVTSRLDRLIALLEAREPPGA
jgi:fumarate reductase subunit D